MKRSSRQGGASERIWKLRSKINDNVKSIMKLAPSDARHRCLQSRGLSPVLVACVRASKRRVMRQEREGGSEDKETKQESARAREREETRFLPMPQ